MPETATTAPPHPTLVDTPVHEPATPRRLWPHILKNIGGILMLTSILVVVFGSWAISASMELVFACTFAWVGGFTLFVVARSLE